MLELLIVVISLFAIVDPLAAIPPFLSFFGKSTVAVQKKAATEATFAAFILLLLFGSFGESIFAMLGISLPAFLIAGGLLLLLLSFDFLHGVLPHSRHAEKDVSDAIVPIATPFLAGPGAITAAIFFNHLYGPVIAIAGIVIVMAMSFLSMFYSRYLLHFFGHNGIKILTRIMAIFTAAIAISFIEKALVSYGLISIL